MHRHLLTLLDISFIFLLSSISSVAQTGWVARTRGIPAGVQFNAVTMFTPTSAVAVGTGGRIVTTEDAGWTWIERPSGTNKTLHDIERDVAVGDGGVVLIGYGEGITWQKWAGVPTVKTALRCVAQTTRDSDHYILIVGDSGIVMHTTNNGSTWLIDTLTVDGSQKKPTFRSCAYLNRNLPVVVGDNGVIFYLNSLRHWEQAVAGTTQNLIAISKPTIRHPQSVVIGDGGIVLGSVDAILWEPLPSISDVQLRDVVFVNKFIGYAVGDNGQLLKSTDNGVSWFAQLSNTNEMLRSVSVDNNEVHGFAVGANGTVLSTFNGGMQTIAPANWRQLDALPVGTSLRAVQCVTDSLFVAVGDAGVIVRSTDRGATWNQVPNTVQGHLQGIAFSSPARGFVVSSIGEIHWSNDSGKTWKEVLTERLGGYTAITCVNARTWFAVTDAEIVRSLDSGKTWQDISPDFPSDDYDYSSVSFMDTLRGTVVGWRGSILTTTDGGDTWIKDTADFAGRSFSSVSVSSSGFGIITSRTGNIMQTMDGVTWTRILQLEPTFDCVSVTNSGRATMGGWKTTLGVSTDFGTTWQFAPPDAHRPLDVQIHGVHHFSDDTRIAVGDYGMILMWDDAPADVREVLHADVQVSISPNPVSGFATIDCVGGGVGTWSVDLVDAFGINVSLLSSNEGPSERFSAVVDTRFLPVGKYWCRVIKLGQMRSHSLTVVR